MNTQQQEPQEPRLCENGCGFFANANFGGLCSKCGREAQANEATAKAIVSSGPPAMQPASQPEATAQLPAPQPALPSQSPPSPAIVLASPTAESTDSGNAAATAPPALSKVLEVALAASSDGSNGSAAQAAVAEDAAEEGPPRRVQKNVNRCFSCNKKIGLTGFKCRCGYVFCGPHRLAEAHDCDFDYKGAGRQSLAKANPLVQADRVARF